MQQFEQPGAHDGAVPPDAGDLVQVEVVLGVVHDLEALGIRLHQPVLDAVVNHLHEVARTRRADVRIPLFRSERLEDRLEPPHRLVVAADHQAKADLQPPDAAGDARVDKVDPAVLRLGVAALRVAEVRVAPVDDRVALVDELQQVVDDVFGDLSGRDHQPEGSRRLELLLQVGQRVGGARLDVRVVREDVMACLAEALGHPRAHPPQADHAELAHWATSPR